MTTPFRTARRLVWVVGALLSVGGNGMAIGGEPDLLGSGQESIPLFEADDCGPERAAPCPTADDDSGGKPTQESATAGLLPTGARAKPFALTDPGGKPLAFDAEADGNPVLLIFWSLFCEPCKEELPYLDQVGRDYAGRGLKLITVNIDGDNMARATDQYRSRNGFEFPVAMDLKAGKKYEAADAYGVTGTPSLFLVGPDGIVRWNHAGRLNPEALQAELQRLFGS